MTILVTGGAGYIGSHATYAFLDSGKHVVVLDNLSTGIRGLVSELATFVEGDVSDQSLVRAIIKEHNISCVIHFAGSVVVPESVTDPLKYYANNTTASRALIETCVQHGIRHFVFSSTAAVYGKSDIGSVSETTPATPINPYGRSKLMTEWILDDVARAHSHFRYIVLRYFNVAGADPKGRTGQSTPNATHLIKRACQVALGRAAHLDIFGTDFQTVDGTGVRDYIHVSDLANIHLLAVNALQSSTQSAIYNCGYGHGFSVREVVATLEKIIGHRLPTREGPRRFGDPSSLIANTSRLYSSFEWRPEFDDLEMIVRHALEWERQNAHG